MSRTYRNNSISEYYSNIESYQEYVTRHQILDRIRSLKNQYYGRYVKECPFSTEDAHDYFKHFRDGRGQYGYWNSHCGYKRITNSKIRTFNKRFCNALLKDVELAEDQTYIDKYTFNRTIWEY